MTLVEAFCAMGPLTATREAENERREAGARTVMDEIVRLRRRVWGTNDWKDDAVGTVLMRLVEGGPRPPDRAPETDGAVRAFLVRALRNALIDQGQIEGRFEGIDAWILVLSLGHDPDEELDRQTASRALEDARQHLQEQVLPTVARAIPVRNKKMAPPGDQFLRDLDILRRIGTGELSPEKAAHEMFGTDCDSAKARLRMNQRFFRARQRVVQWTTALQVAFDELYPRRVVRADSRGSEVTA